MLRPAKTAGQTVTRPTPAKLEVRAFYHAPTCTYSYVVSDVASRRCAIVDPVLDYDPRSARTSTQFIDEVLAYVTGSRLQVDWVLETHVHADHISAAQHVKRITHAGIAIGENVREVQRTFKRLYNIWDDFEADGMQFDRLLAGGDVIHIGELPLQVMHTPGHTSACVTYFDDSVAFVGDTLFSPDYGTARADFPGGSARDLYRSIRRILSLPGQTQLYQGHDYPPSGGRAPNSATTVAEQRKANIHIHDGVGEADFVRVREARDKTLPLPELMLAAMQINMRAGRFPAPESNGVSYLKIPLNVLRA